jgi:hypothetical protein
MSAKRSGKKQSPGPVISLFLILVAVGWMVVKFGRSEQTGAFKAAQVESLRDLRRAQQEYFEADGNGDGLPDSVYADDLTQLAGLDPADGIQITLVYGGAEGWAATAVHERRAGEGCALFVGAAPDGFSTPAGQPVTVERQMYCDQ